MAQSRIDMALINHSQEAETSLVAQVEVNTIDDSIVPQDNQQEEFDHEISEIQDSKANEYYESSRIINQKLNAQESRNISMDKKSDVKANNERFKYTLVATVILLLCAVNMLLCIALFVEFSMLQFEQKNIGTQVENLNSSTNELSHQLLQALDNQTQQVAASSFQHTNTSLETLLQGLVAVNSRAQEINSSLEILSQQLLQEIDSRMQQVNSSLKMLAAQLRKEISAIDTKTEQVNGSLESFQQLSQELLAEEIDRVKHTSQQINSSFTMLLFDTVDSTIQQINSSLELLSQALLHNITEAEGRTQQVNETLLDLYTQLYKDMSESEQQVNATLETLSTQLYQNISESDQQVNATLEALSTQLYRDISESEQQVNATLEAISIQLRQDISAAEDRTQKVNATLDNLSTQLNQDISETESRALQVNVSLEMLSLKVLKDHQTIANTLQQVNNSLETISQQDLLNLKVNSALFSELNTSLDILSQELFSDRQNAASIYTEIQQINSTLITLTHQFKEGVEQVNVNLKAVVCEFTRGQTPSCPASSCSVIFSSGFHWVRASNGSAVRVYCDTCGGVTGGWMRVTQQNFSDPNVPCPTGFSERFDDDLRTCQADNSQCTSVDYSTFGVTYSSVCGRLVGYQLGTPEAFSVSIVNTSLTVDDQYLDGWSLTHGDPPRQHIWSFALGVTESRRDRFGCPCNVGSNISPPSFIGNDYFCDSAASSIAAGVPYTSNPMWDGVGCADSNACCSFNNPPWFYKELPQSTSDDIELRYCQDESIDSEGILIESINIYVRYYDEDEDYPIL